MYLDSKFPFRLNFLFPVEYTLLGSVQSSSTEVIKSKTSDIVVTPEILSAVEKFKFYFQKYCSYHLGHKTKDLDKQIIALW